MGWLTDFVGYSSILTSVLVIACTLAYIPYMLHRMEAITEALKVHNDEFLVLETEARSQLGELRSDYPRIRRATNRKRQTEPDIISKIAKVSMR
ncbi:unnamed protein product [Caenorhabditis brenneri]